MSMIENNKKDLKHLNKNYLTNINFIFIDNSLRGKRRKIQMNKRKICLNINSNSKEKKFISTEDIFKKKFTKINKLKLKKHLDLSLIKKSKKENEIQIDSCNSSTKEDDIKVNISDLDCSFNEEEESTLNNKNSCDFQNSSFIKLKNSLTTKKFNYNPLNITDSYLLALNINNFKKEEHSLNKHYSLLLDNCNVIKEENEIEINDYKNDRIQKICSYYPFNKKIKPNLNISNYLSNKKKKFELTFNILKYRKYLTIHNENQTIKKRDLSYQKKLNLNTKSRSQNKSKCLLPSNICSFNKNEFLKIINKLQYISVMQYCLLIKLIKSYKQEILKILVKNINNTFYFNALYKIKYCNNNIFRLYLLGNNSSKKFPKVINKNDLQNLYMFDTVKNKFESVNLRKNNQDFILFTI